jgi:divalent metal cation (Fe/Co/Zn/Cd) transporter
VASISRTPGYIPLRRIRLIQTITIICTSLEAAGSLYAAWVAHSPSLLAFGGDSAIELLSAIVVLWEFNVNAENDRAATRAARVAGTLLFALAIYVVLISVMTLLGHDVPRSTYLGIATLAAAAVIMPWLSKEKRKLSAVTGSAALKADAVQSGLCAYLSLIALTGLAVTAARHVRWADPIAALVATPLILWEGKETIQGKSCGCH